MLAPGCPYKAEGRGGINPRTIWECPVGEEMGIGALVPVVTGISQRLIGVAVELGYPDSMKV